jgi:parallel beta-helix repeat protein
MLGCGQSDSTSQQHEAGADVALDDAASDGASHTDGSMEGGKVEAGMDGAADAGPVHCPIGFDGAVCPDGSVDVSPDADLQTLVSANEGGTTFCLQPGIHHDAVTVLKDSDTFTSPSGTTADGVTEDGAKLLVGWTLVTIDSVSYWTTPGGTPLASSQSSAQCETGYPGCFYSQDLFFDNVDYVHVTSLTDVKSGTWYYDFTGSDGGVLDNVYLAASESPSSHTVELSQYPSAFSSAKATSITIQGLIVEKYGAPLQSGAITAGSTNNASGSGLAKNWLIQNNEVRLNHGGIAMHPGADSWRILCNDIDHDGTVGFGGGGTIGGLFQGNTIAFGNQDHEQCAFECVMKLAGSSDCSVVNDHVVSYNTVHDNRGNGLWSDVCARSITYDHNTIFNNDGEGIRVEISEDHTVTNNVLYANGTCAQGSCTLGEGDYEGVVCAQCSSTKIENNYVAYADVAGGGGGIVVSHDAARDNEHPGFTVPVMMSVANNTIVLPSTGRQLAGVADDNEPTMATAWIVPGMFDHNTYCVSSVPWTTTNWEFTTFADAGTSLVSFTTWQNDGQDPASKLVTTPCPMP